MQKKLRSITLFYQGLAQTRPFGKGIPATLQTLERLGYIQIDTLSVVERAHHHTLWTRIPDYHPDHLRKLVRDREVFEYWFHAASYLPMRDYRFALPKMAAIKRGELSHFARTEPKTARYVYDRIRSEGPLKVRDFEAATKQKKESWWNSSATKYSLEKLFMQGDLMIADRDGMQKIFDLTERVLPSDTDTTEPSLIEFAEHLIDHALNAYGFTTARQILHLRIGADLRGAVQEVLRQKIETGSVQEHTLRDMPVMYAAPDAFDTSVSISGSKVRLLSPFDNAIIHRDRIEALFDFSYRLECYTPKAKRRFGYFCLPILYKDALVGSVDCKAHRAEKCFELIHLHLENQSIDMDRFIPNFIKAVRSFSKFNGCDSIRISRVSPAKLAAPLRRELKRV